MTDEKDQETTSEATTSGDHSPAASVAHSGTGDIHIDQSVHHSPPTQALTYQGDRLIAKSADELMGYFETHTAIRAARLVEPFLAKPIRVQGLTQNIVPLGEMILVLIMSPGQQMVRANFDRSWDDRLAEPDKGDKLDLMGRIADIGIGGVVLNDCELID